MGLAKEVAVCHGRRVPSEARELHVGHGGHPALPRSGEPEEEPAHVGARAAHHEGGVSHEPPRSEEEVGDAHPLGAQLIEDDHLQVDRAQPTLATKKGKGHHL